DADLLRGDVAARGRGRLAHPRGSRANVGRPTRAGGRTGSPVPTRREISLLRLVRLSMVALSARAEAVMRWLDRLLMAELVVLTLLLGCFLDKDMDIWWHLRAGREILAGRGIPRTAPSTFPLPPAEWLVLPGGFRVP